MSVINIELPDSIIESYQQENESIQEGLKNALVVWEYLNGRLSLRECGELLHVGYRGFIELLWSKGIPILARPISGLVFETTFMSGQTPPAAKQAAAETPHHSTRQSEYPYSRGAQ